ILRLGTRHNHLARGEDEGSRLGLADAHDDGSETLGVVLLCVRTALQKPGWATKTRRDTSSLLRDGRSTPGFFARSCHTRTSALRACSAIVLRSRRQSRLTVATMFLSGSA